MNTFSITAKSALLVAASILPVQAAIAQDSDETQSEENVIVVTGSILQSLQSSVEQKRAAVNVTDVASADDVGRFPDENIAAALTRLPGVAVQRDQGQARYIQVRGAPNRWTSVSIDGIPQTGTDEGGAGRAYRFDAVPAVILSQLRVNKSLTPDLTAEAVTANVDLVTYSALGSDGLTVSGDVGYGFMDLGGGEQRQGALRLGYATDTLGIVIGGSHYKRRQLTDNREFGYSISPNDGELAPTDFDIRQYILDRETNGLYGNVEFEPVAGQKFFARAIYTEFKDDEQRNQYQFELDESLGRVERNPTAAAAEVAAGRLTRTATTGDLIDVPVDGAFNDAEYRNRNLILSLGGELEFDSWGVNFTAGYTNTENTTDLPLTLTTTGRPNNVSLTYDRTDPNLPIITGLFSTVYDPVTGVASRGAPIDAFDQSSFNGFNFILPIITRTESDAYTAKLDIYKEWDSFTVRTGALFQQRDIAGNIFNDAGIVPLAAIGQDANDYVTNEPWDTNFPLGINFTYTDNEQLNLDQQAALAAADIDLFALNPATDFFDQEETIIAPYIRGDFDLGNLQIVAGLRAEYYETTTSGTSDIGGTLTPLSFTQDFFDLFPSVNATFELTPDLLLRVGGMRGTARPAYAAIRIGSSVDDVNEVISAGNPGLRPEYTWGLDGSLEYYLPTNGIISVAVFHRWVQDVLFTSTGVVGSDAFNSNGVDRSGYELSADFNGDDGTVTGVEFNIEHQFTFLPGALGGFGVQGNLTFLDGEFDATDNTGTVITSSFPGLSDTIVNASLFYEKYGISARVSYQWRSEYLDTVGGLGIGEGESRGSYENLDVTLRYQINENFSVYADLANLTDEIYTAFDGTSDFPVEVEQIGARYLFGLRFDF